MAATNAKVEIFYIGSGDPVTGAGHDITSDVYTRDPIVVTRGRPDESSQVPPSRCTLTIDNRTGKYSPRNPSSTLYGLIGRNTPIRVSVTSLPVTGGLYRFYGEIEAWPQSWTVDGKDAWTSITANGMLRRLNAPGTTKPALSALRRTLSASTYSGLLGWWSFENVNATATSVPSELTGGTAMTITDAAVTRSTNDTLPGSDAVPMTTLGTGAAVGATNYGTGPIPGTTPLLTSSGNSWSMLFWSRSILVQDQPSSTTVSVTVKISGSAQIDKWFFSVRYNNNAVAARVEVSAFAVDSSGTLVSAVSLPSTVNMSYVDAWRALRVNVDLSGSDHRLRLWLDEVLVGTVTAASNTPGQPSGVYVQTQVTTSPVPLSFGQLLFSGGTGSDIIDDNAATLVSAGAGYTGDTAVDRISRLCVEEGIPVTITGNTANSELVGVQRVAPVLDLIQDAVDVDGGLFYEPRDSLGLAYLVQYNLYNQDPVLTLNYSAGSEVAPPLEPVEDSDQTANDVTVTREAGASARVVQETGTLNVAEPPTGVGRYRKDVTLVLADDDQCLQQAAWIKHLGTWDEARYPVVNMDLTAMAAAGKTSLVNSAADLDVGDRFSITNPPSWLPPDSIVGLAQGFTEELGSHTWTISINATPALPYDVLELETDVTNNLSRIPAATGATTLNEALDTTETGVDIISTSVRWIDSATYASQFPFDIIVGGERMRVTACTGTTLTQTFTVTRSINGIVKSHAIGTAVQLFRPPVLAR
jgi:hypothetical protein